MSTGIIIGITICSILLLIWIGGIIYLTTDTGHFAFFPKRCSKCRKLFWWETYSKPYETSNISMTLMGVEFPEAVQNIILCESCTDKMKEHKG